MKRIIPALALLLIGAASVLADEVVEVYRRIYVEAVGPSQKYSAVLSLVQLKDRSIAPILGEALQDLMRTQNSYASSTDLELFARTVRIVSTALGDFKQLDAAPALWDVVQQVRDPLAKAEALIALGKMRALDYAERISLLLRDMNMSPPADRDSGEKLAFGAIICLEKMKDSRGFSPVFFAADAWYTQRVRQQAERSLPLIADDPTDAILQILSIESPARRIRALASELASRASSDRKVETAVMALNLGHEKVPIDRAEARLFADLRKTALRGLIALKAKGAGPVPGCAASFAKGYDDEERLLGLAAFGANGEDPAATALRDILLRQNAEQQSGLSDETRNRMARAAIDNAALSKNPIVKIALISIAANDKWSGGIILAAQNAIKALP